ncbi:MAG: cupin domain-containing protein [Nitrosopumilus sp.]
MLLRKGSNIKLIKGNEGSEIKQYFNPENTQNGINYSIAQFSLEPGKKTNLHKLRSSEIYYILERNARLKVDEYIFQLEKDDSVFIRPNSAQCIENIGSRSLKFLFIVEPSWNPDVEILLE